VKALNTLASFFEVLGKLLSAPPSTAEVRDTAVFTIRSLALSSLDRSEAKVIEVSLWALTWCLKLLLSVADNPSEALPILQAHYPSLSSISALLIPKLVKWREEFPESVSALESVLSYWAR
jgi:hypothetical protein